MHKSILLVVTLLLLGGCQGITDALIQGGVEAATDSRIGSGGFCTTLKTQCTAPGYKYKEWVSSTNERRCACEEPG